jgi:hypothetical protein
MVPKPKEMGQLPKEATDKMVDHLELARMKKRNIEEYIDSLEEARLYSQEELRECNNRIEELETADGIKSSIILLNTAEDHINKTRKIFSNLGISEELTDHWYQKDHWDAGQLKRGNADNLMGLTIRFIWSKKKDIRSDTMNNEGNYEEMTVAKWGDYGGDGYGDPIYLCGLCGDEIGSTLPAKCANCGAMHNEAEPRPVSSCSKLKASDISHKGLGAGANTSQIYRHPDASVVVRRICGKCPLIQDLGDGSFMCESSCEGVNPTKEGCIIELPVCCPDCGAEVLK